MNILLPKRIDHGRCLLVLLVASGVLWNCSPLPVGTYRGHAISRYSGQKWKIEGGTEKVSPIRRQLGRYRFKWPVQGEITSRFGQRHGTPHDGIDIGAPKGTPVVAVDNGRVVFADAQSGYGNLIVIRHLDGLMTVYAHNERNLVRLGENVTQGQLIAKVGQTGRASGPHLHFEVRRGVEPENPLLFLPP